MNKIYFIGFLLFSFIFTQCADMNKLDCMFSEDCEWDENIVTGNCGSFSSSSTCSNIDECNWVSTQQACPNITGYSDCVAIPGCSYSWLTYTCGGSTSVTYCSGGSYEVDNSYCEEVSIEYQMGDINGDYIINVLDIIEVINLVLDNEYNYIVDMNNDLDVNVLDIIELVNIILNGEGF